MESLILAISGRKSSGKNSIANYILGLVMKNKGIIEGSFGVTEEGWLWVSDIYGNKDAEGIFDVNNQHPNMKKFLREEIYSSIKLYSFADPLKEFCINVFGLTWEQCYGSDAQKNSLSTIRWEDCPGVTTEITPQDPVDAVVAGRLGEYYKKCLSGLIYHEPGYMAARQVLQYFGTDMCRKMVSNCWAKACLRKIKQENSEIAIITDCRFPDEVDTTHEEGGIVLRLTRNPYNDQHESERVLDQDNYDWNNFDYVLDNIHLSIPEQNLSAQDMLADIGLIEAEILEEEEIK